MGFEWDGMPPTILSPKRPLYGSCTRDVVGVSPGRSRPRTDRQVVSWPQCRRTEFLIFSIHSEPGSGGVSSLCTHLNKLSLTNECRLFGVTSVQTFVYFGRSKYDGLLLKSLVSAAHILFPDQFLKCSKVAVLWYGSRLQILWQIGIHS